MTFDEACAAVGGQPNSRFYDDCRRVVDLMQTDAPAAAEPQAGADPWVDTREVRFDDTIMFGRGGFDFDAWDGLRWEMHTPQGSWAVWKSQLSPARWSMYGGPMGHLALDQYMTEDDARSDAEAIALSQAQFAALAARSAKPVATSPSAGMLLVPREPTADMLTGVRDEYGELRPEHCRHIWMSMIATLTTAGGGRTGRGGMTFTEAVQMLREWGHEVVPADIPGLTNVSGHGELTMSQVVSLAMQILSGKET